MTIVKREILNQRMKIFLQFNPPVDCSWAPWNSWSTCNKPCGGGTRTKDRAKSIKEAFGGRCSGAQREAEACNTQECPGLILLLD